jgi:hypothetical protein
MCWLADNDPMKLEGFNKMPVLEYWFLLDSKIGEQKKAIAQQQKARNKAK